MATDSITFLCPACSVKLTVPSSLAGVTGPCPTCRTLIQAPYPAPVLAQPFPLAQGPLGSTGGNPGETPIVPTPAYLSPPPMQVGPAVEPLPAQTSTPALLRPEPRQLPNRTTHGEPIAKQMPEPGRGSDSSRKPIPLGRHPRQKSPFIRVLVPLVFLIASGALIYGVLTLLKKPSHADSPQNPEKLVPVRTIGPINPKSSQKPAEPDPIPTLPVPAPEQPQIIEPPPTLPDGVEPTTPGMLAMAVLEKFLAAKSLAERLPMIETQTPESELAKSCLNGPLPTTSKIEIDAQETNSVEQLVDFYHNVDFAMDGQPVSPQTILVRIRGTREPKVVVDPFLDTFGGRLAIYAKAPTDKAGVFQVTVSAVASCNDENVPNREKKLTLKLLSRDNTKEIARAYFGRQSKIGEMLEDGTFSLSYGKAKTCTVMLRWNAEDNPSMPYLEALTIKALDWNP